jgi:hypothetical protein
MMETAGEGQIGNIHAELDEHLGQCISYRQALLFASDPGLL